jgi:hypothetical protein
MDKSAILIYAQQIVGDKLNIDKLTIELAASNKDNPWGGYITNAISNCVNFLRSS